MEFSKQTRYFLKKWGWTEETNIDITPYVKKLEEYGYEVFDSVKEFLRHFGGFNFVPFAKNGSPYGKYNWWKKRINRYKWNLTASYMHFDIAEVSYDIDNDYTWMSWYEPRVGEK